MPAAAFGGRRSARDPAVFQYYPGRGMQLQPLASWGKVNWLAGQCLRARAKARRRAGCPVAELRRNVDRAARARGEPRCRLPGLGALLQLGWRLAAVDQRHDAGDGHLGARARLAGARRAALARVRRTARLAAFDTPPPVGVDGGDHFLMYSFAPTLRVFNGELQAVSGIGELAALGRDRPCAGRLFRRGERTTRAMVAAADTGAWSLYSCGRPRSDARLPPADRGVPRRHVPAARSGGPTARRAAGSPATSASRRASASHRCGSLKARHATTVRFSLSKVSAVTVRVWRRERAST